MPPLPGSSDDDGQHDHVLSPHDDHDDDGTMEDLALSPADNDNDGDHDHDHDVEAGGEDGSGSRLIPLAMRDGANSSRATSTGRPLPSLQTPVTYRDLQFVGVYVFQILLVLLATGYIRADFEPTPTHTTTQMPTNSSSNSSDDDSDETIQQLNASEIGIQLRSLSVVNLLFSFGWLLIYLFNAKMRFVQGSCAFATIATGILAITFFSVENNSDATFFAVLATATVVLDVLWIRKRQSGFEFVAVLFELTVDFLIKHPLIAVVTVGTLVAYTMWACWVCTSLGYVGNGASPWQFSMLFLYLHFYWTSNIFKNVLTMVVSGATIIWYYKDDSSDLSPDQDSPTSSDQLDENSSTTTGILSWTNTRDRKVILHYLRGALTTSFGSICIGSLLCPIAHIVWNVLRWARRDDSPLSKRFVGALRSEMVEHFIRTYHKFSFVHVAGYGKPFYTAANDSWKLIEKRGVEAIIDDDMTSRVLLLGANGWASVMCALCVPAFLSTNHVVFFALASFILSYTTLSIATQILGAVIKTLFVCFAESPTRLSQLHPLIYHRFARLAELKSFRDHKTPHSLGV